MTATKDSFDIFTASFWKRMDIWLFYFDKKRSGSGSLQGFFLFKELI